MNILITGITGYFGSQLAREFRRLGQIHGLKRSSSTTELLQGTDFSITWHEGDVLNVDSLVAAMTEIDLVIHAAGLVSFDPKDEENLYLINTQGSANVVNAMLSAGLKRLVHVSSVAAIGRTAEVNDYDENFKWVDSALNTDYALSKYWAELEVWRGEQEGLETLIINPSVLLGKADYGKSSSSIYKLATGNNLFFPKGNLNYIDIRDAAQITRLLVEKNAWGERFILNRESKSYKEFLDAAAKIFGTKTPKIPLSDWVIGIFFPFIKLSRMLGLSKNLMNKRVFLAAQKRSHYSNIKVDDYLKFNYRTLEETLKWAIIG
jgi:nucleoside-diphosphate-sugar epimerase